MSEKKIADGGLAFPQQAIDHPNHGWVSAGDFGYGGMTLRDWFASQALIQLVKYGHEKHDGTVSGIKTLSNDTIANIAYEIADAMIERRNR